MHVIGGQEVVVDEWVRWLARLGRAPETIRIRRGTMLAFAATVDIHAADSETVAEWLASQPGGPGRRQGHLAGLRGFYRWAVAVGHVDHDPTILIPGYHVPAPRKMPVPEHVLSAAIARADERTQLALLLGAYQGLRRTEIASMHSDAVAGDWLAILGKGQRWRRIPIHPLLRDRLAELDGWAFPSPRLAGEHVSPGTIARWVSAALGEGWTAHSLRRRLATRAYRSQHDIRAVQQILGHASISTTQIYVHADEDSLTAAIRAVA